MILGVYMPQNPKPVALRTTPQNGSQNIILIATVPMSTGENDIPVQGGDSVAGHSAPVAASEAPKGELKSSSKPQPFKLPYSNQFDVVFRDVHAMGNKDRVYSDPVTFGPLKWYVDPPLCRAL